MKADSILKFIASDGKSGKIFGSLKYLIVESKMMLLIAALSPLIIKKIRVANGMEIKNPKYLCLILIDE